MKYDPFDNPRFDYEVRNSCFTGVETVALLSTIGQIGAAVGAVGSLVSAFNPPEAPKAPEVEAPKLKVAAKDTAKNKSLLAASAKNSTILAGGGGGKLGDVGGEDGGVTSTALLGG